jgi:hypothetical protein
MKNSLLQRLQPHLIAIGVFLVISFLYFLPVLSGKDVKTHDIAQWTGMAKDRGGAPMDQLDVWWDAGVSDIGDLCNELSQVHQQCFLVVVAIASKFIVSMLDQFLYFDDQFAS